MVRRFFHWTTQAAFASPHRCDGTGNQGHGCFPYYCHADRAGRRWDMDRGGGGGCGQMWHFGSWTTQEFLVKPLYIAKTLTHLGLKTQHNEFQPKFTQVCTQNTHTMVTRWLIVSMHVKWCLCNKIQLLQLCLPRGVQMLRPYNACYQQRHRPCLFIYTSITHRQAPPGL